MRVVAGADGEDGGVGWLTLRWGHLPSGRWSASYETWVTGVHRAKSRCTFVTASNRTAGPATRPLGQQQDRWGIGKQWPHATNTIIRECSPPPPPSDLGQKSDYLNGPQYLCGFSRHKGRRDGVTGLADKEGGRRSIGCVCNMKLCLFNT